MPVYTSSIEVTADYPTIKPSLNLNFARSRSLDPRITFTRASTATYVGRDGLIKTAGEDEPRFDHDPETGESLGLLIEESRTNTISYSIVSDGPQGWPTVQNVTFSIPTDVSAPDGSISDNRKMIAIATNTSHSTYKLITTGSNGQTHTFSVYMKSAGSDYGYIYVDTAGGRLGGVAVQFSTGNTAVMAANGIGTQTDTSVTAVGNGWYRLSVSGSFSSTNNYYCHIDVGNDLAFSTFTGNGTDGIYVWGAQLEAGSFPTSIIPTSGATVTRAVDSADIIGSSFSSFYNPVESTVLVDVRANIPVSVGGQRNVFHLGNDNSDGYGFFKEGGGLNKFFHIRSGGGTIQNFDSNVDFPFKTTVKFGAAFTSGDHAVYFDDQLRTGTSVTTGISSANITALNIGASNTQGANSWTGTISKLVYYPKRLTNAQLQLLTS